MNYLVICVNSFNASSFRKTSCGFELFKTIKEAKEYIKQRITEEIISAKRSFTDPIEEYKNFSQDPAKDCSCYARLRFNPIEPFRRYVPLVIFWDIKKTKSNKAPMGQLICDGPYGTWGFCSGQWILPDKCFDAVSWYKDEHNNLGNITNLVPYDHPDIYTDRWMMDIPDPPQITKKNSPPSWW